MQDSIYARAKRGELPPDLSLEDITRLSSASLDAPLGRCSNDDPLLRLHQLVRAGLLTPARTEEVQAPGRVLAGFGGRPVTTAPTMRTVYYVRAADLRPFLADLGQVGPLLSEWAGGLAGVVAPAKQEETGEAWHVGLVRAFCEAIVGTGEIDPDNPGFTAKDVALAMDELGLWRRPGVPKLNVDTLRGYAATTAGKFFTFGNGRPAGGKSAAIRQPLASSRLVNLYRQGAAKEAENPEPGNRADTVSVSNFRRVAGG